MSSIFFDIQKEKEKEFSSVGFKNQRRNLKYDETRIGTSDKIVDSKRHALLSGKRISKNGKTYWETRKNRSDAKDSDV
jgi:hypothetical protein